jgi:hypothetical protein
MRPLDTTSAGPCPIASSRTMNMSVLGMLRPENSPNNWTRCVTLVYAAILFGPLCMLRLRQCA